MDIVQATLTNMMDALEELESIIVAEVNQLKQVKINPIALQALTDKKSKVIATLQYHDDVRLQQETHFAIAAPYTHQVRLFVCWQKITQRVVQTQTLSREVESLLQAHLLRTQQLQKVVDQVGQAHSLYGPEGETHLSTTQRKYDIRI